MMSVSHRMNVVFHYAAGPRLVTRLSQLEREGRSVSACPEADHARFGALMADAEVLWHLLEPLTADMIDRAPRLRLVQKIGVGVNTIDLEAAKQRGIAVCNMPGTNSPAVAEMTLLLMLATLRRLAQLDAATRLGEGWALPLALQDRYGELAGRTVGLIGYGAVPSRLAPVLHRMGAQVIYTNRSKKPDAVGESRALEELLAESDLVSLHVPLTPTTERLIDAAAISRMKPGAILINTARGALIDEAALCEALEAGRIGAAGRDVFEEEPTPVGGRLLTLENVVVTPHVAWLTGETMERSLAVAVENCRRLAAGDVLLYQVA